MKDSMRSNKRKQTERAVIRKQDKSGAASAPNKVVTDRKKFDPAPKQRQIGTKAKARKQESKEEFKGPINKYNEYDHEIAITKCRDQQKELEAKLREIDEKSKAREIEKQIAIAKLEAQRQQIYNNSNLQTSTDDSLSKPKRKKWNKNSNMVEISKPSGR